MTNKDKDPHVNQQEPHSEHTKGSSWGERILWTLVAIFIIGAIAGMFLADYYNAPGASNPRVVKDAVDN